MTKQIVGEQEARGLAEKLMAWSMFSYHEINHEHGRMLFEEAANTLTLLLDERQGDPSEWAAVARSLTEHMREARKYGWIAGMEQAARICGSLAETTYDSTDAFEAAVGCEAVITQMLRNDKKIMSPENIEKITRAKSND